MKKKFTGILLCLLMSFAFLLSGCSLFPRNMSAYLNKSVCTITYENGNKQEITTEAFINAFNSYGYNLVQNGTSYEDASEQTIEVLINRYVLLNHAKSLESLELTTDDYKEIYDDVYTSLESNLKNFIKEVREEWDLEEPAASESEEKEDVVLYTPYTKTAEVVFVDGEYKIKLLDITEDKQTTNFTSLNAVVLRFKEYALENDNTTNSRVRREAYNRLIASLKENEKGLNLSKDADSILKRYAEKLYTNVEENLYISNLEEYYKTEDGYSTISVKQVLDKYKTLMLQSKFKYEANAKNYDEAMLSSFKDVNYVVDDNYFFVSHILMKYNEEQQAEYDNLKSEYDKGYISKGVYNERLTTLVAEIEATVRDSEGKIIEDQNVSASKVLSDLKLELASKSTNEEKTEVFRDYMYKYNEDPGTQNAEYAYVIGKETSKMVESFTDASRELNNAGQFGAVSELVPSEYGVHIVFYAGQVKNLFTINDVSTFSLSEQDILKLTDAKLNVLNNKTVFDKVFELLSDDNYSIFENMNLNVLKSNLKIEKHKSVYENL